MENQFEFTIHRGSVFENMARVRIRGVKGNRAIEQCLILDNNLFFNYEETFLLEMIDYMIYELKGE